MPRAPETRAAAKRARSPLRREDCLRMVDDTILELCSSACQQELHDLWEARDGDKLGEKELARREVLLKYQCPIVARYGYEASAKGVQQSTGDSWGFFSEGYASFDIEIGTKAAFFAWFMRPELQTCADYRTANVHPTLVDDYKLLQGARRDDLTAAWMTLRMKLENQFGVRSVSAPLCSAYDACSASSLVPVHLPWASGLEGTVPIVCCTVKGLLSIAEADTLRRWSEQRGQWEWHQDHMRLKIKDGVLAHKLWKRMEHLLPDTFNNLRAAGLNEHIRFLRYGVGQFFLPHTDGVQTSREYGSSRHSEMSAILYFTSPENSDSGGGTRFISPDCPAHATTGRCDHHCDYCIDAPVETGSLLIFAQSLMHAGTEPVAREKFAMRTDVMYYD